jgi:hypothetical protein
MDVNYAKLSYQWHQHYLRYCKRVENQSPKLICQECGGMGGEVEPVLDYGIGPWITCGWCEGTGLLTPHRRGQWLRLRKEEKR